LTVLSCFGELFIFYLQKRDGRYYGAVQLIATRSEASKYKCELTLRSANGIGILGSWLFRRLWDNF
jgi:hypothetical protein